MMKRLIFVTLAARKLLCRSIFRLDPVSAISKTVLSAVTPMRFLSNSGKMKAKLESLRSRYDQGCPARIELVSSAFTGPHANLYTTNTIISVADQVGNLTCLYQRKAWDLNPHGMKHAARVSNPARPTVFGCLPKCKSVFATVLQQCHAVARSRSPFPRRLQKRVQRHWPIELRMID